MLMTDRLSLVPKLLFGNARAALVPKQEFGNEGGESHPISAASSTAAAPAPSQSVRGRRRGRGTGSLALTPARAVAQAAGPGSGGGLSAHSRATRRWPSISAAALGWVVSQVSTRRAIRGVEFAVQKGGELFW